MRNPSSGGPPEGPNETGGAGNCSGDRTLPLPPAAPDREALSACRCATSSRLQRWRLSPTARSRAFAGPVSQEAWWKRRCQPDDPSSTRHWPASSERSASDAGWDRSRTSLRLTESFFVVACRQTVDTSSGHTRNARWTQSRGACKLTERRRRACVNRLVRDVRCSRWTRADTLG